MAGSCVQTYGQNPRASVQWVKMAFTADAADGSFPSTAMTFPIDGFVFQVIVDEGGTAPTDDYDIVITDTHGIDIMNGGLADLTADAIKAPEIASANSYTTEVYVRGTPTVVITNNSVNSALVDVWIYWREY